MTVWEKLGERIGYGIGALVFGPAQMMERRTRRTIREALAGWVSEEAEYTRLTAPKGSVRWLVERREDELGMAVEVGLDWLHNAGRVTMTLERLPDRVEVRVEPNEVFAKELEAEVVEELRARIASTPIRKVAWSSITIAPELLVVEAPAPVHPDQWECLVRGATATAAWLARRFRAGYR